MLRLLLFTKNNIYNINEKEKGFYKVAWPDVDLKKIHTYKLWVLNAHHYSVFVSSCLVNKFAHTLNFFFHEFFSLEVCCYVQKLHSSYLKKKT